jgi:hypothetical protein
LKQAEEKSSALRREVRAIAKAAAYAQLEEGLVQSAVAESAAHKIQEQHRGAAVSNLAVGNGFSGEREHLRCVFGGSEERVVVSVQERSHACGVHNGGFGVEQSAAVPLV